MGALPRPLTLAFFLLIFLSLLSPAAAFGAGNIASISKVEGHNWRHGDIEDMLKTVACLKGHKWSSMMIKRVYFGNWLRDYSQAVDVGTLKGVNKDAIRLLLWVLAFMSFGYATAEFEVTEERLGCYRPEEHIDNPKDYADNVDARQYDARLRPPVQPEELEVDSSTGMKNYIANESGGWATSAGYVKHSFARSIHFGRVFTNGANGTSGREADLCEALRCLGQGLHCLEDFGAHTNYVELVLRDMDPRYRDVFAHVGSSTQINLHGKNVYPLVTGTFGGVDFLHSVLGEATDHVTQTEIEELNKTLGDSRNGSQDVASLTHLLSQIPGTSGLCGEAISLQTAADEQARWNEEKVSATRSYGQTAQQSYNAGGSNAAANLSSPAASFDLKATIDKVYPILEFRDKVVKALAKVVSTIPGFEKLIETISEKVTLFVMSILAPYVQPLIESASQQLKVGSSTVISASAKQQFGPWDDPHCSNPTHSMLSKDHFSNVLNEPAGQVAASILQYVAPRIVYGWSNPDIDVHQILNDVVRVFHHPSIRQPIEVHQAMYDTVQRWARTLPSSGETMARMLSSDSVRNGGNHKGGNSHTHTTSHFNISRELVNDSTSPGYAIPQAQESTFSASESRYQSEPFDRFDSSSRQADSYAFLGADQQLHGFAAGDDYQRRNHGGNTSNWGP